MSVRRGGPRGDCTDASTSGSGNCDGRAGAAGRSRRAATLSSEMCREGLRRTSRCCAVCASVSVSPSARSRLREDAVEDADAPESVRDRAVWIVFPGVSENGEDAGV